MSKPKRSPSLASRREKVTRLGAKSFFLVWFRPVQRRGVSVLGEWTGVTKGGGPGYAPLILVEGEKKYRW